MVSGRVAFAVHCSLDQLMLVIPAWLHWPFWLEYSKQQLMNEVLAALTHSIFKIAPQIGIGIYR